VDPKYYSSAEDLNAHIMYCNLMLESVLSEPALLTLSTEILAVKGPLPVGEIGKLLAETTSIGNLSQKLKEKFGGLKKFLERFPNVFVISNDHPFNPNVLLRCSLTSEHLGLIDRGIFPHQLLQKTKKVPISSFGDFCLIRDIIVLCWRPTCAGCDSSVQEEEEQQLPGCRVFRAYSQCLSRAGQRGRRQQPFLRTTSCQGPWDTYTERAEHGEQLEQPRQQPHVRRWFRYSTAPTRWRRQRGEVHEQGTHWLLTQWRTQDVHHAQAPATAAVRRVPLPAAALAALVAHVTRCLPVAAAHPRT
jgi:hypothetical protein